MNLIKFFIVFICLYASDIAAFDDTFEKAQREMIAKITKYRQNADPYLRMEIMNAKGIYETSAGRIFKAFSIYCSKQGTADREWGTSYAEDARRELYRNPQLTMIVLLPILREVSEPKEDSLKFQGGAKCCIGYTDFGFCFGRRKRLCCSTTERMESKVR